MNNEILIAKTIQGINKKEYEMDVTSQKINVIPSINDEVIPFGTILLLSKFYIDIRFIYPISHPSTATLFLWHFPPSLLLSFSFFMIQCLTSCGINSKLISS